MKGKKPMRQGGPVKTCICVPGVPLSKRERKLGVTTSSPSLTQSKDGKTGTPTTSECSQAQPDTNSSAKVATAQKLGVKIFTGGQYVKLNAARCKKCRKILITLDRHDFRECACPGRNTVFIDGGTDGFGGGGYLRVGGDSKQIQWLPLYYRLDEPPPKEGKYTE